jgi:hypothetical protein
MSKQQQPLFHHCVNYGFIIPLHPRVELLYYRVAKEKERLGLIQYIQIRKHNPAPSIYPAIYISERLLRHYSQSTSRLAIAMSVSERASL